MPSSTKRSQEYKDFRFRRRHDHFLRYKLLGAKPEEIVKIAKELGFKLSMKDLVQSRHQKVIPQQNKTLFSRFKDILGVQLFIAANYTAKTKQESILATSFYATIVTLKLKWLKGLLFYEQ